jgi:C-terminal processing protease CtpA/Prc
MRGKGLALAAGCFAMLTACGGGGGSGGGAIGGGGAPTPTPTPTPTTAGCSLSSRQAWVLGQLQEWYLFDTLFDASVNPASHSTVQSYIDALVAPARAQNKDRFFTYITSIAEENAFFQQGATAGFGIRLGYDTTNNRVFVIEAFEGANALAAGMDRGTELLQINGQSVSSLMASGGPQAVINALGPDTVGTQRSFVIRQPSGTQLTVTISKSNYTLDPISDRYGAQILTDGARKIGYINMRTFIDTSDANLRAAFTNFKAQGITELIIDLRYNGGGLVSIAELFGDLMNNGRAGQVSGYVTFRPSKSAENEILHFAAQAQAIAPTKVAFIGTGSTASASELVINGMQPFLGTNMALVGSNTYGKPVGQIALDQASCDDRLRAIAFKIENANHQGEYFNGLATTVPNTCKASDDISHQLGDVNETMVKVALDWLAGRGCTAISGSGLTTQAVSGKAVLSDDNSSSTVRRDLPGAF